MEGSISASAPWTSEVIWKCSANFGTVGAAGAQYAMLAHPLGNPVLWALSVLLSAGRSSCGMLHSALTISAS